MFARFVAPVAVVTLAAALVVQARQTTPPSAAGALPSPSAAAIAQPPSDSRSPRNASYTIAAKLDPSGHRITGEEVLTWRNVASIPAATLQFHLYFNAWRNSRSTWMRERRLATGNALAERPEDDWGWIDITTISVNDGGDRAGSLKFIAPDDGNPHDRTVAELPLERAVGPGETVSVRITWEARVPRTFARTGRIGNFYFMAQWFPKIGVLEDTGWNTHQFHSATEFFADFGTYDVRLNVPSGWVVGATGTEQGRAVQPDGSTTHHYRQDDVHDFAWTTSPDFVERRERFEHATLPPVDIRLLLQPEHAGQAERHFTATRAALKHYGEWYGPYPYGHVTVVDPAWQSGAGGMEYPTLFTAGTRWIAPRNATQPESVTIHEAGHQFWYGIVASNEFEHAWLDEGFNTFSTARTIEAAGLGPHYYTKRYFDTMIPWVFRDLPLSREIEGNRLHPFRLVAENDAQSAPTWRYWPGSASAMSYNKTSLWLHTLERMIGWDTLQRVLSTYFTRWAYKHPKPEDFFAVVNEVTGRDFTWFFDQVHRSSNTFDYGVDLFTSEPDRGRGYTGDGGQKVFASREGPDGMYRTRLVVRRYGEAEFPVDVRVTFANGQQEQLQWDGRDRWKLYELDRPSRAVSAQVDPGRVLLLDINYTNNSATLAPQAEKAARKWSLVWLIWLQDHLLTYGFFI